jgi:hypothetical protein
MFKREGRAGFVLDGLNTTPLTVAAVSCPLRSKTLTAEGIG